MKSDMNLSLGRAMALAGLFAGLALAQ